MSLDDAGLGSGRLHLIEGRLGAGKTTVLRRLLDVARAEGLQVWEAYASYEERNFAYGVVRQLLEPVLLSGRPSFPGSAASPAIELIESGADQAGPVVPFAVLHGIGWLVRTLSSRAPIMIAVDDALRSDIQSQQVLAYLARRVNGMPLTILFTATSGERCTNRASEEQYCGHAHWRSYFLPELDHAETRAAILASLPEAEQPFIDACVAVSSGNPFFLKSILAEAQVNGITPVAGNAQAVARLGPSTVATQVARLLCEVSPDAAVVAKAIALLGPTVAESTLPAATRLSPLRTSDALDALRRCGLLQATGSLAFTHPVVENALQRLGGADANGEMRGGNQSTLALRPDLLRMAARSALDRGDPERALSFLSEAVRHSAHDQRFQMLRELVDVEQTVDVAGAIDRLDHALTRNWTHRDRTGLAVLRARVQTYSGDVHGAAQTLTGAQTCAPESEADRLAIELLHTSQLEPPPRADIVPPTVSNPELARDLNAAVVLRNATANLNADDLVGPAREIVGVADCEEISWTSFLFAALPLIWAEDRPTMDQLTQRHADAVPSACTPLRQTERVLAGIAVLRSGRLEHAKKILGPTVRPQPSGSPRCGPVRALAMAAYLESQLGLGEFDDAEDILRTLPASTELPQNWCWTMVSVNAARLAAARGDLRTAAARLIDCGNFLESHGFTNPAAMSWRSEAALLLNELGEAAEARALADQELTLARTWGRPRAIGIAMRTRGNLESDSATSLGLLSDAVDLLRSSTDRFELTRSLGQLGKSQQAAGRVTEARETLRAAVHTAEQLDAMTIADGLRRQLLISGARPRRAREFGLSALTPSERKVAMLAAEGMSNREISERLFVTTRTVETHLTHCYRKLDIRGRAELTAHLNEFDSDPRSDI